MKAASNPNDKESDPSAVGVVIADDHPIVRSGIRNELASHNDIVVLGEAVDGDEALHQAQTLRPDVLLLDINMAGLRAVQVVRELCEMDNPPRVLVLSAFGDLEYVLAMLRAGAAGYMLKEEDPSTITEGVRAVVQGETWLSSAVSASLVAYALEIEDDPVKQDLSPRETEVLGLLARGLVNEQIAESLCISIGTVKNHVSNIYEKLRVQSRAEAVAWAWQHGIVTKH
ncbi:MAG: response regulator transcription factor [Anaerolineales bacterium]|jgi:DNA-binding NarL/FixJ family response regulator